MISVLLIWICWMGYRIYDSRCTYNEQRWRAYKERQRNLSLALTAIKFKDTSLLVMLSKEYIPEYRIRTTNKGVPFYIREGRTSFINVEHLVELFREVLYPRYQDIRFLKT